MVNPEKPYSYVYGISPVLGIMAGKLKLVKTDTEYMGIPFEKNVWVDKMLCFTCPYCRISFENYEKLMNHSCITDKIPDLFVPIKREEYFSGPDRTSNSP